MSKELDEKLLKTLKEFCKYTYNRPVEFDVQTLGEKVACNIFELSHSLNNLQREGLIRIHIGRKGELNKVELLPQKTDR